MSTANANPSVVSGDAVVSGAGTPEKAKRKHIDLFEFVKAWNTSNSVEEVAAKTGLAIGSIPVKRTDVMKRYGVTLKEFARKPRSNKVNADELRAFAEQILREEMEKKEKEVGAETVSDSGAESEDSFKV